MPATHSMEPSSVAPLYGASPKAPNYQYSRPSSAMSSSAASPLGMSPTTTPSSQKQQYPKTNSQAQKEEQRKKTKLYLHDKLSRDFEHLTIPFVTDGDSILRGILLDRFRTCGAPHLLVDAFEMAIRQHKQFSDDFKLGPKDKEQIKLIPKHLALEYIIEQRKEDENKKAMGWEGIAKNLKAGMGYHYAKGSCENWFKTGNDTQGSQCSFGQPMDRGIVRVATPSRRRHSLEVVAPSKTPRRSQAHLSPWQDTTQSVYSPSAIPTVYADTDTDIEDYFTEQAASTQSIPPTPLTPSTPSTPPTLSSNFHLMRFELAKINEIKAELEIDFAKRTLQHEQDLKTRDAENASTQKALRQENEKLEMDNDALRVYNKQLIEHLESEKDAKKILQIQFKAESDAKETLQGDIYAIKKKHAELARENAELKDRKMRLQRQFDLQTVTPAQLQNTLLDPPHSDCLFPTASNLKGLVQHSKMSDDGMYSLFDLPNR